MDQIDELLARGVDQVLPSKEDLEKVLRSGKKLRVYQGFDPSSPQLHIGHMIGLRKLRQWQDLGHEVIFLIGDFTGRIGDPTGKEETRPLLSKEQVEGNAKTYKEQAGKILRFTGKNPVKVKFNSQWLDNLSMPEVFNLAAQVTYQQVIKRGMFKTRLQKDQDISFNELMYPIMQGYDSIAMDVDVEVGGSDQLFNMMMGRHLMHKMKGKNKFVMTTQLLTDAQGNKVGKTEGNATALVAPPDQIFGAIMNFPDETVINGLEYLTDVPQEEIQNIEKLIKSGQNPLQFKKKLAFEIVKQLDGENAAQEAQEEFESVIQEKQIPLSIPTVAVQSGATITQILQNTNLTGSASEAKRLIDQKAVSGTVNPETIPFQKFDNPKYVPEEDFVLKKGTREYRKIRIKK